jgi:hypothetical protein
MHKKQKQFLCVLGDVVLLLRISASGLADVHITPLSFIGLIVVKSFVSPHLRAETTFFSPPCEGGHALVTKTAGACVAPSLARCLHQPRKKQAQH